MPIYDIAVPQTTWTTSSAFTPVPVQTIEHRALPGLAYPVRELSNVLRRA